ncbi:hypothetical protein [Bradyrhizobium erythrophlei]|jgi:hypothetical protein|uniref:Uncharacterized protein n=1 Tax=Bradyrhizobium erythrophlei TaxID=1437360 RepID=A0A1M7UDC5_9BRAD|nr:hypothetical protein [Bradyrhizobium erythrophlei]SHN80993.1 hypothetical protein SAMN05444170_4572 [Bradyrhizobium erythrophlei]
MSEAVKLIVDGYVRLKDRVKIEELREHRQGLRNALKGKNSDAFDTGYLSRLLDSELEVIEAGLTSLQ